MSTSLLAQSLAKLGELATSLGTVLNNIAGVQTTANTIRTDVTSARDNVNATTNAARDNVKSHVTSAVGGIVRQSYTVLPTVIWLNGNGGAGGVIYADIPIGAVNVNKAFIQPQRLLISQGGIAYLTYRFISSTVVRVEASYGSNVTAGSNWVVGFSVTEFS